jgi:hypothetical protein
VLAAKNLSVYSKTCLSTWKANSPTVSLRGIPFLLKLREAGFSIWPFESVCWPCVIEIYPRVLTGEVNKGKRGERERYLREHFPELNGSQRQSAASSEDAFDAAVSAMVMSMCLTDPLLQLPAVRDEPTRLEGKIWTPDNFSRP